MSTPEEQKAAVRAHTAAVVKQYKKQATLVDLSCWNWGRPINFVKLKEQGGIEAVCLKATEGRSIVDSCYHKAYNGAKAAGLRVSPYLFYRPGESIDQQVSLFIATVGQLGDDDLIPTVDLERATPDIPAKHDNELLEALLLGLFNHFGRWPLLYTSERYCKQEGITAGNKSKLFAVDYVNHSNFRRPPQWSESQLAAVQVGYGPLAPGAGIEGDVDQDLVFVDYEELALFPKKPAEAPKVLDTSALEAPFELPPNLPPKS